MNSIQVSKDTNKSLIKKRKNLGKLMGNLYGVVIVGCLSAITIALTIKLITWLLCL